MNSEIQQSQLTKAVIIDPAHEHDTLSELDGLLYHVLIKAYVR